MKRLLALALVTTAGWGAVASAAASSGYLHLTQIGRVRFPERSFLLDLPPNTRVRHSRVEVLENGKPVRRFSLTPIQTGEGRFGVVLVIDASDSMRGAPSAGARAAARAFVRRAAASEQVGLVSFNRGVAVLVAPTQSGSVLDAALAKRLALRSGTRIYDAVDRAIALLQANHVAAGSIVVLSDGADTGSHAGEAGVAARARAARIRIFTVGLRSRSFRAAPLERLARDTGAVYSEASSSAELTAIYDSLGRQLSTEYVLDYRSTAAPHAHVSVVARVHGVGTVTAHYAAPEPGPIGPYHPSLLERFWSSAASLVLVALMIASLAALVAVGLLRVPKSTIMSRIGEFVSLGLPGADRRPQLLSERLFAGTERSLARTEWWARFNEDLEIARISIPAVQIVVGTVIATAVTAFILMLISPIFVVFALGVPLVAREVVNRKLKQVRDEFASQLPDNLQVLASALRAGHSFIGALSVVAHDAPEPAQREFRRIVADDQLGVPIDDSMREVARRLASQELEQVALLAELQRGSGGNMAEVLDTVVETIRDRFDLRRLVKTLTAQGRMARWILTLLPVFLALAIALLNPAYMRPLFGTTAGQTLVGVAALMVIAGSLVIKRIVNIKV